MLTCAGIRAGFCIAVKRRTTQMLAFQFSAIGRKVMASEMESVQKVSSEQAATSGIQHARRAAAYKRWGRTNPFFRYGLPFISLTVFGAIGLAHIQQGRKDMERVRDNHEWEAIEITKALSREGPLGKYVRPESNKINLEIELKALQKRVDINNFEYKKIPRPNTRESEN